MSHSIEKEHGMSQIFIYKDVLLCAFICENILDSDAYM